jgi:hypothetical protein
MDNPPRLAVASSIRVVSSCVALGKFGRAVNRNALCRVLPAAQIFALGGGAAELIDTDEKSLIDDCKSE